MSERCPTCASYNKDLFGTIETQEVGGPGRVNLVINRKYCQDPWHSVPAPAEPAKEPTAKHWGWCVLPDGHYGGCKGSPGVGLPAEDVVAVPIPAVAAPGEPTVQDLAHAIVKWMGSDKSKYEEGWLEICNMARHTGDSEREKS